MAVSTSCNGLWVKGSAFVEATQCKLDFVDDFNQLNDFPEKNKPISTIDTKMISLFLANTIQQDDLK